MNWYDIISLIISSLSLPTIAGLIWKDIHDKRQERKKRLDDICSIEQQKMIRGVFKEEVEPLLSTINSIDSKLDSVCDGTLSTLRNDILQCYYDCLQKGYRSDYDYQNVHDLDDAYIELHGNSFISDIMERFDALPTKEEYELSKKRQKAPSNRQNP